MPEGARAPTTAAVSCKLGACTVTDDVGVQQPEVTWIIAAVVGVAIRNRKVKGLLPSFCLIISDQRLPLAEYKQKPTEKGTWKCTWYMCRTQACLETKQCSEVK